MKTVETTVTSKTEQVKALFEVTQKYLNGRKLDIRLRAETVQEFIKGKMFDRVLDIGCGDGSISLPLLPRCRRITLLDVATNMLALARNKLPAERICDVDLINSSFIDANLKSQSFDLVICVGVLAHVDSPQALIAEIARVAKPGASIILEFTDRFHIRGLPNVAYHQLLNLFRPAPYSLNRLSNQYVMRLCHESELSPTEVYRYGLPPLGTNKILGPDKIYEMTRYLFGRSDRNRNKWIANEFIYHLKRL